MFTISLLLFFFFGIALFFGGIYYIIKKSAQVWKKYEISDIIKEEWNK